MRTLAWYKHARIGVLPSETCVSGHIEPTQIEHLQVEKGARPHIMLIAVYTEAQCSQRNPRTHTHRGQHEEGQQPGDGAAGALCEGEHVRLDPLAELVAQRHLCVEEEAPHEYQGR